MSTTPEIADRIARLKVIVMEMGAANKAGPIKRSTLNQYVTGIMDLVLALEELYQDDDQLEDVALDLGVPFAGPYVEGPAKQEDTP